MITSLKARSPAQKYAEGKGIVRIHSSRCSLIRYCEFLRFGEIEKLKIQDGHPVMEKEVKSKVRFGE